MSLKDIMTVAQSDFVFAILFIGLLVMGVRAIKAHLDEQKADSTQREEYILQMHERQMNEMKENMLHERASSHELIVEQRHSFEKREAELLKHLQKNTDQLASIADTLKDVQRNLSKLEDRVEDNFMEVWKELGAKQDKK
jgi:DNA-binding response OmpR family regulator